MKIYVIADAETYLVFALAGLKGQAVKSGADVPAILNSLTRESAGLVLITEALAQDNREAIDRLMMDSDTPLIVEIPDIHGPLPQKALGTDRLVSLMRR
jgi:vacuolar-type H+-ATPase subunit F/Vma7